MFTPEQIEHWRSQMYEVLDSPVPFARWIRAKGREIVGRGHHPNQCPIHCFLVDAVPWLDAEVGTGHVWCQMGEKLCLRHGWLSERHAWSFNSELDYYGGYAPKPVPEWVKRFIRAFDSQYCLQVKGCRIRDGVEELHVYNSYAKGGEVMAVLADVLSGMEIDGYQLDPALFVTRESNG